MSVPSCIQCRILEQRSSSAYAHRSAGCLLALLMTTATLVCAKVTAAEAAVVSVVNGSDAVHVEPDAVAYVAAPGETNHVVFHVDGDHWTVTDPTATLTPGEACMTVDQHTVVCGPRPVGPDGVTPPLSWARASLGDLDDEVSMAGMNDPLFGAVAMFADGGPGSDRLAGGAGGSRLTGGDGNDELVGGAFGPWLDDLRGGPGNDRLLGGAGFDELDGGGGRDALYGGADDDSLVDGDRDDGSGEAGPGPDLLDGGGGFDTVSYKDRSSPISVDLHERRGGAVGEGDTLNDIEAVTGGRADDRLAGDASRNVLDGRAGEDRLIGRGGNDLLSHAGRSISCGTGKDTFDGGTSSRDLLPPDCEIITQAEQRLTAYPQAVTSRAVRFRVGCPTTEEGSSLICSATLLLRQQASPRRLLASGRLRRGLAGRSLHARLTPAGRRLAGRRRGVRATVRVAITAIDASGMKSDYRWKWSIQLSR